MARLENWTLHTRQYSNGTTSQYLTGNVFGHPKADWFRKDLTDGHEIITELKFIINKSRNIGGK